MGKKQVVYSGCMLALPPGGRIACHKEAYEDHHDVPHSLILFLFDPECQQECGSSNESKQLAKGAQQEHAFAPKLQNEGVAVKYQLHGFLVLSYKVPIIFFKQDR